ncbi:MAG TPA: metal-dependent transcriptional regulator [Microbacteriaceae bacterium]|nr:metal-dependent transcriptional regulator [Microbacteriaceae bacterium]HQX35018.1 metal-dependent transcriptional regulator [Microbacteriaceae bacterium]HQZ46938.1 metal-dependent transcriptional regulator [Microbacteriaceae bacterium]HRA08068.1 metal-dependent transcriptional regulator [Microbacteriaceae bacterium]
MPPTSPAVEDYLKTVYQHTEWQDQPITPKVLADALGVAPSSVTEMVKKMATAGLVSHVPYGAVRLTPEGEARALQMVRRHRIIETWLVREHGYNWDEVHDEAEVLEHALSDRLLDAIDAQLGRPRHDPHGDAIPAADGTVPREPFVLLANAPDGHEGRVIRVSDRDPALLRAIDDSGLQVGDTVVVISTAQDATALRRGTTTLALPGDARDTIWLSATA